MSKKLHLDDLYNKLNRELPLYRPKVIYLAEYTYDNLIEEAKLADYGINESDPELFGVKLVKIEDFLIV